MVRSTAIFLVLVSHTSLLVLDDGNLKRNFFLFLGTIGVDIFFVLSGILIGDIIYRQILAGKMSFKHFYHFFIRRWFRTLPNYYIILFINILMGIFLYKDLTFDIQLWKYVFFIQNFSSEQPDFFSESWSLSIEEFSYIVGPILLFLILKKWSKSASNAFVVISLSMIFIAIILRYTFYINKELAGLAEWSHGLRKVVIYRIDSIYYGFIAIYLKYQFPKSWTKYSNQLFTLGLVLFILIHLPFLNDLSKGNTFTFNYLINFYLPLLLISILLGFPLIMKLRTRYNVLKSLITTTSKMSYSLYLINYSIVFMFLKRLMETGTIRLSWIAIILFWVSSFIMTFMLFKFYEQPMMKLRENPKVLRVLGISNKVQH